MIGIIIFITTMLTLFVFSLFMAAYNDSDFWAAIAAASFAGFVVGVGITQVSSNKERDIQYKQDILELKLLEQRIELFDLQIEQLKLNINNK